MLDKRKVIYFKDELNDEFSTATIIPRKIDETYDYGGRSVLWNIIHFFLYRIIAVPVAFFYLKFKFAHKIENRRVIRPFKNQPFFVYANHTNTYCDPLVPTFVCWPKDAMVIVHPNNVSIPVVGRFMPFVGALPLPDTLKAGKNFMDTIAFHVLKKRAVMIYPEAHIWPFYTKIRPFKDSSFKYPVEFKTPAFCFTNVYKKRKFSKTPKMITYVDGPFFADETLSAKEARKKLRDEVYEKMCERSLLNEVEVIKYIKQE